MFRDGGWLTLVFLLLFAAMAATAFGYPVGARLMPAAVGVSGMAMCLLQLALEAASGGPAGTGVRFHPAPKVGRPEEHDDAPPDPTPGKELATWGYFLAFIAGLLVFGFHVAVPALLFFYLWREAGLRPAKAAAATAVATAAMIALFVELFGFTLFPGFAIPALQGLLYGV